jgi:hypothetical protein
MFVRMALFCVTGPEVRRDAEEEVLKDEGMLSERKLFRTIVVALYERASAGQEG